MKYYYLKIDDSGTSNNLTHTFDKVKEGLDDLGIDLP